MSSSEIVLLTTGAGLAGVLLAVLTGQVGKLLGALVKILATVFFVKKTIDDYDSVRLIFRWLKAHARQLGSGDDYLSSRKVWIRSEERYRSIFFKNFNNAFNVFVYRGRPLFFVPNLDSDGKVQHNPAGAFYAIRGTLNWVEVARRASELELEAEASARQFIKNFRVIRQVGTRGETADTKKNEAPSNSKMNSSNDYIRSQPLGHDNSDLGKIFSDDPLGDLSLGPVAAGLVREVKQWFKNKEWYQERGIAWRRGIGLYGKPGTGKTRLIGALAEDADVVVHTFDLPSMSNQDFIRCWTASQFDQPRFVLFEDFDNVFKGRENISGSDLTFDTILNAIDGIERQDGMFLWVTTNKIEDIDPAMGVPDKDGKSTRPGRLDRVVELPPLDYEGRLKLAMRITKNSLVSEKLAKESLDDTAAQFQERCTQYALEELWG